MTWVMPYGCDRAFLLVGDAGEWVSADDVAHVVVAAVERVPVWSFAVRLIPGGTAR